MIIGIIIGFILGGAIGAAFVFGITRAEIMELREMNGDLCRRIERQAWEVSNADKGFISRRGKVATPCNIFCDALCIWA